jgi:hypothetical protein
MVRESKFRGKALEKSRKRKTESEQRPSRGLSEASRVYGQFSALNTFACPSRLNLASASQPSDLSVLPEGNPKEQ